MEQIVTEIQNAIVSGNQKLYVLANGVQISQLLQVMPREALKQEITQRDCMRT